MLVMQNLTDDLSLKHTHVQTCKNKFEILNPRIGFISSNSSSLGSYISLEVLLFKLNGINSTLLHLIF